jgi:hypothetical protein
VSIVMYSGTGGQSVDCDLRVCTPKLGIGPCPSSIGHATRPPGRVASSIGRWGAGCCPWWLVGWAGVPVEGGGGSGRAWPGVGVGGLFHTHALTHAQMNWRLVWDE